MNTKSIRTQMLIYLLVGLFALFGILMFVIDKELNKLPENMKLQYQEITTARANEVSKELEKFVQETKLVSQSPVIQSMDLEKIKDYLPHFVIEGQHRNMTFATLDGAGWTTLGAYIDISEQEQYQKIIVEGYPYWISQPFISPYADKDMPIVIISHEVRKEEDVLGLVNIVISNRFLNNVTGNINLGNSGVAWIVNKDGKVVAHPDASNTVNSHISDLLPIIDSDFQIFRKDNSIGWLEHKSKEGEDLLTFYKSIEGSPGWALMLTINTEEVLGEISNARLKIILSLIFGILLMSGFAFYYANSISKPILELKNVFEEAETGDLEVAADETVKNEIGAAAKSFNKMLRQIKKLTYHDPLTNLYNLNGFLLELPHKTKRLKEKYPVMALAVISIDDFTRINSISGYKGGNEVLQKLANQLLQFVDQEEGIGRYFGDEFILLLKGRTNEELEERIRLLWKQCSTEILIKENEFRLKVSMGVTIASSTEIIVDEFLNQANIAKLQAKKDGGNRYQYYDSKINVAFQIEQKIENALYYAIEKNELYLAFQPIVDLKTNAIKGTEALIRWNNKEFGTVSPLKLIEVAEKSGLIIDIGKWVLKEALTQNKKWQQLGYSTMFVSVNISAIQFEQPNFVDMVKNVLEETNLDPQFLELEITESNAMSMVEEKLAKMRKLKDMGIRIAIDDFGTGYSSLAYFTRLPINTLKIDRSFVNEIYKDDNAKTIITTIINMARSINITTTAEGVENLDQVKFLEEKGCDKIQGYLISRPVDPEQIEVLFKMLR
ncbi:MAG: EAL domain-containing protein [Anaerobacillus sp.]|uniref:bifunctional diguanylate cyclase/phosphodiesterase n=1 Tax=Anaerobacillus sp. TaxID=1872506 RepID=UPI00391C0ECE